MKIAIPTSNGRVDNRLSQFDHYTIYRVENNQVVSTSHLEPPRDFEGGLSVALKLYQMGVRVMLVDKIAEYVKNKLEHNVIKVIKGYQGTIDNAIHNYLEDALAHASVNLATAKKPHAELGSIYL